jgi:hypothetical protein
MRRPEITAKQRAEAHRLFSSYPLSKPAIASRLGLTHRQVGYALRGVEDSFPQRIQSSQVPLLIALASALRKEGRVRGLQARVAREAGVSRGHIGELFRYLRENPHMIERFAALAGEGQAKPRAEPPEPSVDLSEHRESMKAAVASAMKMIAFHKGFFPSRRGELEETARKAVQQHLERELHLKRTPSANALALAARNVMLQQFREFAKRGQKKQ